MPTLGRFRFTIMALFMLLSTMFLFQINANAQGGGVFDVNLEGGWMGKDTLVNTDSIYLHVGKSEGLTANADAMRFRRLNSVQTWCRLDSLTGDAGGTLAIQSSGKRARPGELDRSWITIPSQTLAANGATFQTIIFEDNYFTPHWLRVAFTRTSGTGTVSCECWTTVKEIFKH